jgi:transposase
MKKITVPANNLTYRLHTADRSGVVPIPANLDRLIAEDHPARLLWAAVVSLDLDAFHLTIKSVSDHPGVPATDPTVLLALWLFGLSNGVISGRELDRLCTEHLAYMWLCGGISTNYHTLNDFRVANDMAINELFVQIVGRLLHAGLVDMETVAHDGMRIRAAAGTSSFHRGMSIDAALEQARAHLQELATHAPDAVEEAPRRAAARERAAKDRIDRLQRARQAVADLQLLPAGETTPDAPTLPPPTDAPTVAAPAIGTAPMPPAPVASKPSAKKKKKRRKNKEPRASTTDPDARVMHFPDGGFRPAYNEQVVVETSHALIISVGASTNGSDQNQTLPALEDVVRVADTCQADLPKTWLTDGGFVKTEAVEATAAKGITLIGPVPDGPSAPMNANNPTAREWRERMATPEMKERYKTRAATVELCNARDRCLFGLYQIPVRGLAKVHAFLTLAAIAYDIRFGLIPALFPPAAAPAGA